MNVRVGIDIGGTFTDLVLERDRGPSEVRKVLSTPEDLVQGVLEVIAAADVELDGVELFVHGTTAGVNALLERKGARTALVTTEGMRDTYLIGRGHRPDMYNLHYRKPDPLTTRDAIFEVSERLEGDGSVLRPLDPSSVAQVAKEIMEGEYEAVAVCLLHSYVNPVHELEVALLLAQHLPEAVPVVLSHQVASEWREYERTSTTVTSAYITPIVRSYLSRLGKALSEGGLGVPLHIMQSNGGAMTAGVASERAVLTLFSGPVGGVVGARAIGQDLGETDLIGIDMGGTSFDVSLVRGGEPTLQSEFTLQGLPILAPAVEMNTIGAGGGSLIREDAGGLRVGPMSAGAMPGPACYGRGGLEPTVSDANVALGRIPTLQRLAGSMEMDADAAHAALGRVGERLGVDARGLAEQALEVTHFSMAEAIRELTVERGLDPSDFVLCAFGGAGPLHAAFLAEELEIDRVLVPALPGGFSAWGMLQGDVRHDVVQTLYRPFADAGAEVASVIEDLRSRVADLVKHDGLPVDELICEPAVELRYVGQEYSLLVPLPDSGVGEELRARFHAAYQDRYGHASPDEPIEFVAVRLAGTVPLDRLEQADVQPAADGVPVAQTDAWFDGEARSTHVYTRDNLPAHVASPAIIVEESTTTVVPPGWSARLVGSGHLLLEHARGN